jgi:nitrous oxidase accessory protein NosD
MRPAPATVRFAALLFTLGAALTLPRPARAAATTIALPAGSVNGLAAAIAQAGPGGTVILKGGLHKESGPAVITAPVNITGEAGAILQTATPPSYPPNAFTITITGALQFKGAPGSVVRGVWFQPPAGTVGSAAVILEDSPGAQVLNNRMTQLQYGVFAQHADNAVIRGNTISLPTNWDLDPSDPAYLGDSVGILIGSAQHAQVIDNQVSDGVTGINASGPAAEVAGNTLTGNLFGILLCSIPDQTYRFSASGPWQTDPPPSAWYLHDNISHNNQWGVLATDRANNNLLANNNFSGNQVYDMELTGDTMRFGVLGPSVYDNLVLAGSYTGLIVKDCGRNDRIVGDVKLVDHSADPCK